MFKLITIVMALLLGFLNPMITIGIISILFIYMYHSRKETLLGYDINNEPIFVDTRNISSAAYDTAGAVRYGIHVTSKLLQKSYEQTKVQSAIARANARAAGISLDTGWRDAGEKCKEFSIKIDKDIEQIRIEADIKYKEAMAFLDAKLAEIKEAKARVVSKTPQKPE